MRTSSIWVAAACLALAGAASSTPASSGPFSISPLRLELDDAIRDAELEIRNTGDEPLDVQLRVEAWAQNDAGQDVLSATEEILVFPRIARIEAGVSRLFRVAHRFPSPIGSERTYRLFAEELVSEEDAEALQFALQISIPVFVGNDDLTPAIEVASSTVTDGVLRVVVENAGTATGRVGEVRGTGLTGRGREVFEVRENGWYVLPGVRRPFTVPLPDECTDADRLRVEVSLPEDSLERTIDVDPAGCRPGPGPEILP